MKKILLIEDEQRLREQLSEYLSTEGYEVETLTRFKEAKALPSADIVLLDWMLPDGQGIDLLAHWRRLGLQIPVILLTARSELVDRILGLELGANDYLTKPFEPRELLARIRAHIRTQLLNSPPDSNTLEFGGIELDRKSRAVTYRCAPVHLVRKEFELLEHFLQHPNQVFSREELLNQVWGYENYPSTRTIDTHMLQLRQKMPNVNFETIRGVGYRLRPDEQQIKC